ncbi:MAG: alkaline phosphatase family protein [Desulfurococcaceae archaeon]
MEKFSKLILFIYIDALDFNKLNLLLDKTSFFRAVDTVLSLNNIPGYSFGIQSTLLTSKLPQEHKHWMPYIYLGNKMKEKEKDMERIKKSLVPIKRLLPLKLRFNNKVIELVFTQSNNIVHRIITGRKALLSSIPLEWFDKIYVYPYYYMNELPFFKMLEKEISKKGCQVYYLGHNLNNCIEKLTNTLLESYRKSHEKVLLFLYVDDLDRVGHRYGAFTSHYLDTMLYIDVFLRKISETCESVSKDFVLLVFSDHGMCDTAGKVDLVRILKRIIEHVEFAVIDATLAFVWLREGSHVDDVVSYLELQLGDQAIVFTPLYNKRELERYGVYFNNREYGDVIIQLKPCRIFYPNFYSSLWWLKALHGFWPTEDVQKSFLVVRSSTSHSDIFCNLKSVADVRNILFRLVE